MGLQRLIDKITGRSAALRAKHNSLNELNNYINSVRADQLALINSAFSKQMDEIREFQDNVNSRISKLTIQKDNIIKVESAVISCISNDTIMLERILQNPADIFCYFQAINYYPIQMLLALYVIGGIDLRPSIIKLLKYDMLDYKGYCYKISPIHRMLEDPELCSHVRERLLSDIIKAIEQHNFALALSLIEYDIPYFKTATVNKIANGGLVSYLVKIATESYDPEPACSFIKKLIEEYGFEANHESDFVDVSLNEIGAHALEPVSSLRLFKQLLVSDYGIKSPFEINREAGFKNRELFKSLNMMMASKLQMPQEDIAKVEFSDDGTSVCIRYLSITHDIGCFISEYIFSNFVSVTFYHCDFHDSTSSTVTRDLVLYQDRVIAMNVAELHFIGCQFSHPLSISEAIRFSPKLRKVTLNNNSPYTNDTVLNIYLLLNNYASDELFKRCKIEVSNARAIPLSIIRPFYERMHAAGALDEIFFSNTDFDSSMFVSLASMLADASNNHLKRIFLKYLTLDLKAIKSIIQIIKDSPELSEVDIYNCTLDHGESRTLLAGLVTEVKGHCRFKQFNVINSGVEDYTYAPPIIPVVMSHRGIPQIEYSADGLSVCIKHLRITNEIANFISDNIFHNCMSVLFYDCKFEDNAPSIIPMGLQPNTLRVLPANVRELHFVGCDLLFNMNISSVITDNPKLRKISIRKTTSFPADLLSFVYSYATKVANDEWFQRCKFEISDVVGKVDCQAIIQFYERMQAAQAFEEIFFDSVNFDSIVFERLNSILSNEKTNKIKSIFLKNISLDAKAVKAIVEIIENAQNLLDIEIYNCNLVDEKAKLLLSSLIAQMKSGCCYRRFNVVNCGVDNYSREFPLATQPSDFERLIPSLNLDSWKESRAELLKQAVSITPASKNTRRNSNNAFRLYLVKEEHDELKESLIRAAIACPKTNLTIDIDAIQNEIIARGKTLIDTFFTDYVGELKSFDSSRWYGSITELHIIARILGCRINLSQDDGSFKVYGSSIWTKEIRVIRSSHLFQGYCAERDILVPNTSDELNLFRACIHASLDSSLYNNYVELSPLIEECAQRLQRDTFKCVEYSQEICEEEYKAILLQYVEAQDKDINHISLAARDLPQASLAVMEKFISLGNMIYALSMFRKLADLFEIVENKNIDHIVELLAHLFKAQQEKPLCFDYTIDVGNEFNQFESIDIQAIKDNYQLSSQAKQQFIDAAINDGHNKLQMAQQAIQTLTANRNQSVKDLNKHLDRVYREGKFNIDMNYAHMRRQQSNGMARLAGTVGLSSLGIGLFGAPLQQLLGSSLSLSPLNATLATGAIVNTTASYIVNGGKLENVPLSLIKSFAASKIATALTSFAFEGANIYNIAGVDQQSMDIIKARVVTVVHNASEAVVHAVYDGNNVLKKGAFAAVSSTVMSTALRVDPRISGDRKVALDAATAASEAALEGKGTDEIINITASKVVGSGASFVGGELASRINEIVHKPPEHSISTTRTSSNKKDSTPPSGSKKRQETGGADTSDSSSSGSSPDEQIVMPPRLPRKTQGPYASEPVLPPRISGDSNSSGNSEPSNHAQNKIMPPVLFRAKSPAHSAVGDWYDFQIYHASKGNHSPSYAQRISDVFISPAYGKANELSAYERSLHQGKMRNATYNWLMGNGNLDHLFTGAYQAPSPDMRYYWSREYASRVLPEFSLKQIFSLSESQRTSRLDQRYSSLQMPGLTRSSLQDYGTIDLTWQSSIPSKKLYSLSESNSQYIARVFRYRYRPDFSDSPAIDNIAFTAGVGAGIAATLANMFAVPDDNFMHTGEFPEYTPNYRDIEAIDNAIYAIRNISTTAKPIFNAYVQDYQNRMSEAAQHRDDGNHFMSGFTSSSANLDVAIDAANVLTIAYGGLRLASRPLMFLGRQAHLMVAMDSLQKGRAAFALTEGLNSAPIVNESAHRLFAAGTSKQIVFSSNYANPLRKSILLPNKIIFNPANTAYGDLALINERAIMPVVAITPGKGNVITPYYQYQSTSRGAADIFQATKLAEDFKRRSLKSMFNSDGTLSQGAIDGSRQITPYDKLGNKKLLEELSRRGPLESWGKYETDVFYAPVILDIRLHKAANGVDCLPAKIHFYKSKVAPDAVYYGLDFKIKYDISRNPEILVEEFLKHLSPEWGPKPT